MRYFTLIAAFSFLSACGGDLGSGKHVKGPFKVLTVMECYGGDGFFAGNRTCPVSVSAPGGGVYYGKVWGGVFVGQSVYRECWTEEEKSNCFAVFTTKPRMTYLDGGIR